MDPIPMSQNRRGGGIGVWKQAAESSDRTLDQCLDWLDKRGMTKSVDIGLSVSGSRLVVQFEFLQESLDQWTPGGDTLQLANRLSLSTRDRSHLEKEILFAMLAGPVRFEFPSLNELESAIRVRCNIVEAARKTYLSFAAYEAERPMEYWDYDESRGFVVRPGKCMIEALRTATQPPEGVTAYSFSCYRATEYVVALGLAEEANYCNQELLKRLQHQAEKRVIRSGEFHEVFMREYGSRENPLPAKYYVPGDRVWFRNPDAHSSDALGFEGSWVFYLGDGLFSDFWKSNQSFTLQAKCLEIFHWRNATYRDSSGELLIDEKVVQNHIKSSLANPEELQQIMQSMEKLQDPRGVYLEGGCIDPSREYPRWVYPETSDIVLPEDDRVS